MTMKNPHLQWKTPMNLDQVKLANILELVTV